MLPPLAQREVDKVKSFVAALGCALITFAALADAPPAPDPAKVKWQWGVKIPLRDGVKLNATVYTPREQKEPAPCVFTLTPYISQSYHDRGVYFASHGYPFLTVDVRGRGNSEGQFRPLIQEAQDGHDVV
jgi:predicted acyl esterase